MKVNIKKLFPEAITPRHQKSGDAGLDLTAISIEHDNMYIQYGTGLSIEIPEGFVGLIYPRSSLSNYDLILSNHVGVIDSNYRGEIKFRFKRTGPTFYHIGDRIGQLIIMPFPKIELIEVEDLFQTERGSGGFGSSGN